MPDKAVLKTLDRKNRLGFPLPSRERAVIPGAFLESALLVMELGLGEIRGPFFFKNSIEKAFSSWSFK
jgi:hypothetical protein